MTKKTYINLLNSKLHKVLKVTRVSMTNNGSNSDTANSSKSGAKEDERNREDKEGVLIEDEEQMYINKENNDEGNDPT